MPQTTTSARSPRAARTGVLLATVLSLLVAMTATGGPASAANDTIFPARPGYVTCHTPILSAKCGAWDRAARHRKNVAATDRNVRAAAVYAYWLQLDRSGAAMSYGGIDAANVARASYRNDACGRAVYYATMAAIARQYNSAAASYNSEAWARPLLDRTDPMSVARVATRAALLVSARVAGTAAQKYAAGQATKNAINRFDTNPYGQVLTAAIGVSRLYVGQNIVVEQYLSGIRIPCQF